MTDLDTSQQKSFTINTNFELPIPLFFGMVNPWERFISHHSGNNLKLTMDFQKVYTDDQLNVFGENKKHMYNKSLNINYEINSSSLTYNTMNSNEEILKWNLNNMNRKEKIKFNLRLKFRLNLIKKDMAICDELLLVLKLSIIKFSDIETFVLSKIKNKPNRAEYPEIIKKILTGHNLDPADKINKFVYERINHFIKSHETINFKKDNFGKHNNTMFNDSKFPMSSTVMKRQLCDNHELNKYVADLFPTDEKDVYHEILKNINSYTGSVESLEKNRVIEIFCSNVVIFSLINDITNYKTHIQSSYDKIVQCPHMILNPYVIGFNKTYGKIIKCDDAKINKIKWNNDIISNRKLFSEIFMLNTYSLFWGHICENNKIYASIGFAICKSTSNNKYNIFPVYDEDMDFEKIGMIEINEYEKKYLLNK